MSLSQPAKKIADCTDLARVSSPKPFQLQRRFSSAKTQRGVTLIELMVGLIIGLLVVGVAMGALIVARGVTGTVNDASDIQQQAAYAMRVIGQQLRQAGSLYLEPNTASASGSEVYMTPVSFEEKDFDSIKGTQSPLSFTSRYRRYKEAVHTGAAEQSLVRNCIGAPADDKPDRLIESAFSFSDNELRCGGNSAPAQPIISRVADFQVRYLLQNNTTDPGNVTIRYIDADNISATSAWDDVQALEVCMVLYGEEAIDMPAGSTYTGCDGTEVNMSTLTGPRARRMHIMFRNVFQLRSQGLIKEPT